MIAFTTGFPDAGNALHRNFQPPKPAAAPEPMEQDQTAVESEQQNSSAAASPALTEEQAISSAQDTAPLGSTQRPIRFEALQIIRIIQVQLPCGND